jgi:hypothetical protein
MTIMLSIKHYEVQTLNLLSVWLGNVSVNTTRKMVL